MLDGTKKKGDTVQNGIPQIIEVFGLTNPELKNDLKISMVKLFEVDKPGILSLPSSMTLLKAVQNSQKRKSNY